MANKIFNEVVSFNRNSSAHAFAANGRLVLHQPGVPRIDHDPITGEKRGLLIEYTTSNAVKNSQEIASATFSKSEVTVLSNVDIAIDGTTSADAIVANTTSGSKQIGIPIPSRVANEYHTISVYVKPKSNISRSRLFFSTAYNAGGAIVDFNLSGNGSIAATSGHATTQGYIQKVSNDGWYRCSVSAQSNSSTSSYNCFLQPLDDAYSSTFTGDGVSGLYVWGLQLERGDKPTSYMPSSIASTGVRQSDVLFISMNSAPWFSKSTQNSSLVIPVFSGTANIVGNLVTATATTSVSPAYFPGDTVTFSTNANAFSVVSTVSANSFTVNANPGNQTTCTLYSGYMPRPISQNSTFALVYSIPFDGDYDFTSRSLLSIDGTSAKRVFYYQSNTLALGTYDQTSVLQLTAAGALISNGYQTRTAVMGMNTTHRILSVNGEITAVASINANMLFSSTASIDAHSGQPWGGMYLKKVLYYPRLLSNSDIISLSTSN